MNLEQVEACCLKRLAQADNPLMPVRQLLEACRAAGHVQLEEQELLDFLRAHQDMDVMEGPAQDEEVTADGFAQAGFDMGPRVILKSRIPSQHEMVAMLQAQVAQMRAMLEKAIAAGLDVEPLAEALARAQGLEEQVGRLANLAAGEEKS